MPLLKAGLVLLVFAAATAILARLARGAAGPWATLGALLLGRADRSGSRVDLRFAADRIRAFHEEQRRHAMQSFGRDGVGVQVRPLARVGIYVPGTAVVYPSSVLMTALPARAAGVEEVLRHFFATRPLAVITNKPEAFSRSILEGLGLAGYFREILGYDSVERKKPHPEGILQVLQGWGVEPTRAVMVGDSDHDILAGKAAGTVTVAVAYGFKSAEELLSAGPDYLIHDIRELIELVAP
ncbi:MAG: HAD-IA family hydrolase [Nitrospinae bacterium]|nr:HAD-IA family hydrolase [Nitrospinota bacterium]